MGITIDRLNEADIDNLFEFRSRVFPQSDRQLDRMRWAWLYLSNPFSCGKLPVWVLRKGGQIVGSIASTDTRVKVGEHVFVASFGNDFFVEKQYIGIFSLRLLKTMLAEYPVNIMANDSESSKKLFTKMGYSDLSSSIEIRTAPLLPSARFKSTVKRICLLFVRNIICPTSLNKEIASYIPQEIDTLWRQVAETQRVCVIKDMKYLKWRYEQCPTNEFNFISVNNNGRLRGVAVVTNFNGKGVLADLLVPRGDKPALFSLIKASLDYFRRERCEECFTHISTGWHSMVFSCFGFYRGVSDLGFMVRTANKDISMREVEDPLLWNFCLGDTDRL